jgi:hypothetical protein
MGQPRAVSCSDLDMTWSPSWSLTSLQWDNGPSHKQDLKEKTVSRVLGRLRGLDFRWETRRSGQKSPLIINHMSFRFPIDFMAVVLGPCESLRMLRELTM